MSDKKISQLSASTTPLAGTEVLPIVQSGQTVKTSIDSVLTTGRPASFGNLAYTGTLTGGAGVLNIGSGQVYKSASGDIGFGTESPASFGANYVNVEANGVLGSFVSLSINGTRNGYVFTDASGTEIGNVNAGFLRAYVNGAVRLNVASGGDVTVNTGNLVIGTSGKGIDFSADGQAAGMTSELLDDYEEGTWTATISDGTTDATMNATRRVGTYTRIGRQVTVHNYVATTDMTGVTGNLRIKGLPFTVGNSTVVGGAVGFADSTMTLTSGQVLTLQTADGVDYIVIRYWDGASGTVNMPGTKWGAASEIGFTLTYFV